MDWESPYLLLLSVPLIAALVWIEQRSAHPMPGVRKRLLLCVRALGVLLALIALAGPARVAPTGKRAVVMVLDHSQSLGEEGLRRVVARANEIRRALPGSVECSFVSLGSEPAVLPVGENLEISPAMADWQRRLGTDSDFASAVEFAATLFPAGTSRQIVLVGDGQETRGSLASAARHLASAGVQLSAAPVAGERKPDVRVRELAPNRSRLHEGASLRLTARLEGTLDGEGVLKLFENGVEVEKRAVRLRAGQGREETFSRTPGARNIFKYRAVIEGFPADEISANNDALAIVDVRGRPRLLFLESDAVEGQYLRRAMDKEGIELDLRGHGAVPSTLDELAGYDAIILSNLSATQAGERAMQAMRDYVDKLGGGLLMLGGPESFGVGGYFRTPIEEILPVRLKAPDEEEKQSAALALVLDRSGSMSGEKLEMAKSASIAAAEVLGRNDSIGVYAFDSTAHVVAPMARITSIAAVAGQIAAVAPGGGTNLEPAFTQAREALRRVKAKVKHMIILTDGQTSGSGYEQLAAQCRVDGITISTVAIGEGSHVALLQSIASSGGGTAYSTTDVQSITRIFTQDTLMHTGRMIREEPFEPAYAGKHPMLAGLEPWHPPALLGYVKTLRKPAAQVPLVTDLGDPLLAHWRFGLGKVTAFTSDAKSRWASLWISRWEGFGRFWSQVLRETARPPQGQRMDLTVTGQDGESRVTIDLLSDAGTRGNNARVTAEVFHVPADALGAPLRSLGPVAVRQTGPGLYEGAFEPEQPGVYLVRAQAGAEMVSAGLVHNPSSEVALGTVNEPLLREAAEATGGRILAGADLPEMAAARATEHIELWPRVVVALLLLFIADVIIRRWEHAQGLGEAAAALFSRGKRG